MSKIRTVWTEDMIIRLKEAHAEGLSAREIATKLNTKFLGVFKNLHKLKLPLNPPASHKAPWTIEQVEILKDCCRNQLSYQEIIRRVGKTRHPIEDKLKELNIIIEPKQSKWPKEDVDKLIECSKRGLSLRESALQLKKPENAVKHKAKLLQIELGKILVHKYWGNKELEQLKEFCQLGFNIPEICDKLQRSDASVRGKIETLGLSVKIREIKHNPWTEEECQYLKDGCSKGLTCKEIGNKLQRDHSSVSSKAERLHLQPKIREQGLTENQAKWVQENYNNFTNKELAIKLGVPKSKINNHARWNDLEKNRLTPQFQELIIEDYKEIKNVHEICKKHHIHPQTFLAIRNEHGIKKLKRKRRHRFDVWVEKYGEKEAKIKWEEMRQFHRERMTGKRSPIYGHPPKNFPKSNHRGYSGRYKEHSFRSCLELCFLILMDINGIKWVSGEREKHRIEYTDEYGKNRFYFPDFILENKYIYEIKPTLLQNQPNVVAKAKAAREFCSSNGLKYIITNVFVDKNLIHSMKQHIKFNSDLEEKFQKAVFSPRKPPSPSEQSEILFPFIIKSEMPPDLSAVSTPNAPAAEVKNLDLICQPH